MISCLTLTIILLYISCGSLYNICPTDMLPFLRKPVYLIYITLGTYKNRKILQAIEGMQILDT